MKSLVRYALENGGSDTTVLLPKSLLAGGFAAANPTCVTDCGGVGTMFGARLVDYGKVIQSGSVRFVGPAMNQVYILKNGGYASRNALFSISGGKPCDSRELDFGPGLCGSYYKGLEDMRLVSWDGSLYAYGTRWDMVPGMARICLYRIGGEQPELVSMLGSPAGSRCEKNWSAVDGRPFTFVYSWDPFTVVEASGSGGCSVIKSGSALPGQPCGLSVRGSSQVAGAGDGMMLAVVHSSVRDTTPEGLDRLRYRHAFAVLDESLVITRISEWFVFRTDLCEFCCGLSVSDGFAVIPYSQVDCTVNVLRVPIDALMRFIYGDVGECPEYGSDYLESLADTYLEAGQARSADALFGAAAAGYGLSDPRWVRCAAMAFGRIVSDLRDASDGSVAEGVRTRLLEAVVDSGGDWRLYKPLSDLYRLEGRISDADRYSAFASDGEWLSKLAGGRTF